MNITEALKQISELAPGKYHSVCYNYSVHQDGVGEQSCWGYIDLGLVGGTVSHTGVTWDEVISGIAKKLDPPRYEIESIEELPL